MRVGLRAIAAPSWAVLGVVLLLVESVVRLGSVAIAGIVGGLRPHEWAALAAGIAVMGYVEGYRTFSRSFGPRVVERSFELAGARPALYVALGPLYAMSLVGDTRRRMAKSWALVAAIVALVVAVRSLPPTWRGIVDASVALSLSWGVVALCAQWLSRLRRELDRRAADAAPRPRSTPGRTA